MEERFKEPGEEAEEGVPFFPIHFLKEVMVIFIVLGLLLALVTFLPPPWEPKADPFNTPEHIKPEWYFLAPYQFLKLAQYLSFMGLWAPKLIGVAMPGLILLLVLLLPFIDLREERHPKRRPAALVLGILGVMALIALTLWGHYS